MARNVEQEDRSYAFVCRACSLESSRNFAVTIWHDEDGVAHESYARSGVPVPDPTREPLCPRCGSNRMTVQLLCHGHPVTAEAQPELVTVPRAMPTRSIPPRSSLPKVLPRTRAFP